jgi:uncharacterized protein YerC
MTSSIYHLLNPVQIELLNNSICTIAEIKNLERKLELIQRIRTISSQYIDLLLVSEGILKGTSKIIGYAIN